jgi:hypothetical protein
MVAWTGRRGKDSGQGSQLFPLLHRTATLDGPKKFLNSRGTSQVHPLAELMHAWITPDFAISLKKPPI